MTNTNNAPAAVTVPVKSAAISKINLIQLATATVAILNEVTGAAQQVLPFVPAKYQHYVTVGIMVAGAIATVITRTFFTTSITPQSAAKLS